jgi:hypothetical protein
MTHPDIDGRRSGRSFEEHDFHNWSLRPVVDDPAVGARMRKAIRLRAREALVEAAMSVRERDAYNLAKIEERENALGAVFGWTPDDDGFSLGQLSPADFRLDTGYCGGWTLADHNAGFDHQTWYCENGRPVAIVSQPYRPAFEQAKREGLVAEVERVRGIRVVELDPVLGWYSPDPVNLPTSLAVWMRRLTP